MDKNFKITIPKYQQIAMDVAFKIVNKDYSVGDKIYARSSLASQYGVSSETARRAICVLTDLNIVDTTKGSGVIIKSHENAVKFVQQYRDTRTVNNLKKEILNSAKRQAEETLYLQKCLEELIDKTDRFRASNPFVPFEVEISEATPYLNKTASDINFWHNTSATIIAIKRGETMLMSPGPYASFSKGDILYFLGDDNCYERVIHFLYPEIVDNK